MSTVTSAPIAAPVNAKSARATWRKRENFILGLVAVVCFLIFWETTVIMGWAKPLFVSSPTRIVKALVAMIADGSIWNHLAVSGMEFLFGYTLAVVVGIPLGILMGWYRRLNAILDPFVSALYATPRIALVPLIIIWFGVDLGAKIAIIFLATVFPILVSTITGVRTIDRDFIKVARSFGASDRQIFLTVALPSSVPMLLTGLRLGLGHALIGIVVGEMIGAQAGIGYMMSLAGATFQTDRVFVGLVIIAGAGMLMTEVLRMIERRFESWRVDTRN